MLPLESIVLPNTKGRVGKNRLLEYGSSVVSELGLFSTDNEHDSVPPPTTHVTDCKNRNGKGRRRGREGRRREGWGEKEEGGGGKVGGGGGGGEER